MVSASQAQTTPHRVLFFAHTPPPFHGQSWMVQLMLEGLRKKGWVIEPHDTKNKEVDAIHLDCKYSQGLEDFGKRPFQKLFLAIYYIAQATLCKYRHHLDTLYFIPAPAKRVAIYRDWLVLGVCRLFYKRVIFHWHAIGLGWWVEKEATFIERWISKFIYKKAISLSVWHSNTQDADYLSPVQNLVLPNAIPDPCPDYEERVASVRKQRKNQHSHQKTRNILFLSQCTKKKGLFDAVNAVCEARTCLKKNGNKVDLRLVVAGMFVDKQEYEAFLKLSLEANGRNENTGLGEYPSFEGEMISYLGMIPHSEIGRHYSWADIYIFPSGHHESFGLVLLEAAYYGLPCVTTQPLVGEEGLSSSFHHRLKVEDIHGMAKALCEIALEECNFDAVRKEAVEKFSMDGFIQKTAKLVFESE